MVREDHMRPGPNLARGGTGGAGDEGGDQANSSGGEGSCMERGLGSSVGGRGRAFGEDRTEVLLVEEVESE